MNLFQCQHCRQPLYFESRLCDSCGRRLGYLPARAIMTALEPSRGVWRALVDSGRLYRLCVNAQYEACNWLVDADHPEQFCAACRHNRMIPDLSVAENLRHWRKIEIAKHRLFYTLLKLRLPLATRAEDPTNGLAFDFIADQAAPHGHIPVMTGYANGLITINLAEADDPERERQRQDMDEAYRTLLGHFRHEIAHYYWDRLVAASPNLEEFRKVFGDEQQDYVGGLQRHYSQGPERGWPERFVSAYASAHPWEDFAETFAHYFHMVDTLETANAFGLSMEPKLEKGAELAAKIDFDPHAADMDRIIEAWLPLAFAVNSINRSMGLPDLYPFALAPPVIVKLGFVHHLIRGNASERRRATATATALRAIAKGLRRNVGAVDPH
jgi:hypothetical protein